MKVLVTGACGQLGYDVVMELLNRGHDTVGSDRAEVFGFPVEESVQEKFCYMSCDITQLQEVESLIRKTKPEVVIHCAAWTAVDAAEEAENVEKVMAVNRDGTKHLAMACQRMGSKFLYISTDYVFDGQGETPWKPEQKEFSPLNVYGRSKYEGERAVAESLERFFIIRIAWVFGIHGKNFIDTMLSLAKTHEELRVVSDQIGTPTYTYDLARLLVDMAETEKYGYYHVTNEGEYISWYEFAKEIFKQAAALGREECGRVQVFPVTTAEYGASKAKRPYNSRLERSKLQEQGFEPLPDWKDALERYLKLKLKLII